MEPVTSESSHTDRPLPVGEREGGGGICIGFIIWHSFDIWILTFELILIVFLSLQYLLVQA